MAKYIYIVPFLIILSGCDAPIIKCDYNLELFNTTLQQCVKFKGESRTPSCIAQAENAATYCYPVKINEK